MNYSNTFILVADDCPAEEGIVPLVKEDKPKPIHAIQYDLISGNPYKYTQEGILFMVYAKRNAISINDQDARGLFLKKSQPCLRSSALSKQYVVGVFILTTKAKQTCTLKAQKNTRTSLKTKTSSL